MASVKRIGKTSIDLEARGCIGCGTEWSHAWKVAKTVLINIGGTDLELDIPICGDCLADPDPNRLVNKQTNLFE